MLSSTGAVGSTGYVFMLPPLPGDVKVLASLAEALPWPCIGIHMTKQLLQSTSDVTELAWRCNRLLPWQTVYERNNNNIDNHDDSHHHHHNDDNNDNSKHACKPVIRLIGHSFGCRIAYRMAQALEAMGEHVELMLLDGFFGPDSAAPPRLGGHALLVAKWIMQGGNLLQFIPRAQESLQTQVELMSKRIEAGLIDREVVSGLLTLPDRGDITGLSGPSLYISYEDSHNSGDADALVALAKMQHRWLPGDHFAPLKGQVSLTVQAVSSFFTR